VTTYLEQLAAVARAMKDDDYGAARHIAAEKDFFDALDLHLTGKLTADETKAFDAFCSKATTDERIAEGLRLAAIAASR
jgi:hypothetical protein